MQPAVTVFPAAIALLLVAAPLVAQENPADELAEVAAETAPAAVDAAVEDAEEEEDESAPAIDLDDPAYADLDEQTYDQDDDDFVPTEEIPADEAIPFPTDI